MKRIPAVLLAVALVVVLPATAAATARTLWASSDFSLTGRLVDGRLTLRSTNRTDFPLRSVCRFVAHFTNGEDEARVIENLLYPGQVDRSQLRRQARFPTKTRCHVNVADSWTIMWRSDRFVVLGGGEFLTDGRPLTELQFFNKTASRLRMTCTWWAGATSSVEIYPDVWSHDLGPSPDWYGFGLAGLDFASIRNFECARHQEGQPFSITVPEGLSALYDNGTFLVVQQVHATGYYMKFINRLDTAVAASCSWTDTYSFGYVAGSWSQNLYGFGIGTPLGSREWIGGLSSGGTGFQSSTGMTCTVTPA